MVRQRGCCRPWLRVLGPASCAAQGDEAWENGAALKRFGLSGFNFSRKSRETGTNVNMGAVGLHTQKCDSRGSQDSSWRTSSHVAADLRGEAPVSLAALPSTSPCVPRQRGADASVRVTLGGSRKGRQGLGTATENSAATRTGSLAFGQAESVRLSSGFTEIEPTLRARLKRGVQWCAARAYRDMVTVTGKASRPHLAVTAFCVWRSLRPALEQLPRTHSVGCCGHQAAVSTPELAELITGVRARCLTPPAPARLRCIRHSVSFPRCPVDFLGSFSFTRFSS